jgi:Ras family protein
MYLQRSIVVLGWSMVGKTALCKRFASDRFDDGYEPTYENSFSKIYRHKNVDIECIIKDTQGLSDQEIFRSEYGLGFHGYVLAYSISSRRSFDILKTINLKLLNLTGTSQVPRILVGNKCDLDDEDARQVSRATGQALADQWGIPFVECSAKANLHVDLVFRSLFDEIERHSGGDDDGDEETGCHLPLLSACCACDYDVAQRRRDGSALRGLTLAITYCTLVYGISLVIFGIIVGLHHGDSSEGKGSDAVGYFAFGIGIVTVVVALVGRHGILRRRREILRTFSASLLLFVTVELAVMFSYLDKLNVIQHHRALTLGWAVAGWWIQLVGSYVTFRLQRKLKALEGDDEDGGGSGGGVGSYVGGSVGGGRGAFPPQSSYGSGSGLIGGSVIGAGARDSTMSYAAYNDSGEYAVNHP